MPNVSLVEPLPPDSLAFTGHQPYSASPSNSVLQVTMWPEDPWQSDHLACPTSTAFHANILVANSSHQRVRSRMASNLPVKVSRLPQTTLAFFGLSHRQTMPSLSNLISYLFSLHSLYSSNTTLFMFFGQTGFALASGPLRVLFPLPRMLFLRHFV